MDGRDHDWPDQLDEAGHQVGERLVEFAERHVHPNVEPFAFVPHEGEAAVVRWMFEEYASGRLSLIQLAKALLTRAPVRRWSPGTLHTLIQNPVYLGDVVGGRRRFIDGSKAEPEAAGRVPGDRAALPWKPRRRRK